MEFHRSDTEGQPNLTRSSKRLSQSTSTLLTDVKLSRNISCACIVHQPINVPPEFGDWDTSKNRQDARPMVSSNDHRVYLSYSKLDETCHITVIKQKGLEDEIFLTLKLQASSTGHQKYKIKNPSWHHITVHENNRTRELVLDLEKGREAEVFTSEVKRVLDQLEHGGLINGDPFFEEDREFKGAEMSFSPGPSVAMSEQVMPSGLNRPFSAQPTPAVILQQIVDTLQAAILEGKNQKAKELADRLATERIPLSIKLDTERYEQRIKEQSISVKVNVEDRASSGILINLHHLRPSDTVGDLKRRMFLNYEFPVEVQRWIIGRRIPKDTETLHKCGIRSSGHTIFLYIITARDAGIVRENAAYRGHGYGEMGAQSGDYMTMQAMRASLLPTGSVQRPPVRQTSNVSNLSGLSETSEPSLGGHTPQRNSGPLRNSESTPTLRPVPGARGDQRRSIPDKPRDVPYASGIQQGAAIGGAIGGAVTGAVGGAVGGAMGAVGGAMGAVGGAIGGGGIGIQAQATGSQGSPGRLNETQTEEVGWTCPMCTFLNKPTRPGCEVCGGDRPEGYQPPIGYVMTKEELCWLAEDEEQRMMLEEAEREKKKKKNKKREENFTQLLALDGHELVQNRETFDCPICFDTIMPGNGVVLRECLHTFCRDCLMQAVRTTEEASLQCPYQDDDYTCPAMLQDREVRALVSDEVYARYLQRSLDTAESQASNSYHCKTPDCHGWCIYEDLVNFFVCPVCRKENCLTCKAIHDGMNCRQYQDDLRIRAANDTAAQQTQVMLQRLVSEGEAMPCPQCKVIVQKKDGCDWIKCSICKTEICWVTKGPRWGPKGEGDISGGCGCRVNGAKCNPKCNNCH